MPVPTESMLLTIVWAENATRAALDRVGVCQKWESLPPREADFAGYLYHLLVSDCGVWPMNWDSRSWPVIFQHGTSEWNKIKHRLFSLISMN